MADLSKEFEGSIHLKYRKREIIFVVTVLVLALIWFAVQKYLLTGNAGEVQITVGGEIYGTYSNPSRDSPAIPFPSTDSRL